MAARRGDRARWWRITSTRTRVLAWFLLIVTIALTMNLVVIWRLLDGRAHDAVHAELEHEVVKFREFAERAVDPATGAAFTDVNSMMTAYLAEAVPEEHEALFSVIDGRAANRTRNDPPARLDRVASVVKAAAEAKTPFSADIATSAGMATYAVVPVKMAGAQPRAALVVVEFTAESAAEVASTVRLIAVGSIVALAIAGLVAWLIAGRVLAPIRQVRATAEAINETDLTRRIDAEGDDDVAQLAQTFNRMLDRLERTFATQRGFLDDAAHELRTPLTVVRGHLELLGDDPAEREQTKELVLDELRRMSRIVHDLLLLANAERPDFLRIGEVDLTDLAVDVVSKSTALGERKWTVSSTTEAVVLGDAQRLTQALIQLADNAVRHTDAGDRISTSAIIRSGQVELAVTDEGEGIPSDLGEQLFDRFRRGPSASRSSGAGLGLAIVRSIARAHGGEASARNMPGGGAQFLIRFPARYPSSAQGESSTTVTSRRKAKNEPDPHR